MFRSHNLALAALVPLGALLTACGGVAVDTSGGPGYVSPSPSGGPSASPSSSAGSSASTGPLSTPSSNPSAPRSATSGPSSRPAAPAPPPPPPTNPGGTHSVAPTAATITVTPSTGLSSGQTVTIRGAHFDPKVQVIAVQCVDNGNSTQASNCNINILALPKGFYPAADGTFTTTLTVQKSFGSNTCSASTPCLVSVTEPNNNPTEEADAPISFR